MEYTPTSSSDPTGMAGLLMSPQVRSLMREKAEIAQALYRAQVARRTGDLARETRVETYRGGRRNDRWCARVISRPTHGHAAAHEFGADGRSTSGAHDWPAVLGRLGST